MQSAVLLVITCKNNFFFFPIALTKVLVTFCEPTLALSIHLVEVKMAELM